MLCELASHKFPSRIAILFKRLVHINNIVSGRFAHESRLKRAPPLYTTRIDSSMGNAMQFVIDLGIIQHLIERFSVVGTSQTHPRPLPFFLTAHTHFRFNGLMFTSYNHSSPCRIGIRNALPCYIYMRMRDVGMIRHRLYIYIIYNRTLYCIHIHVSASFFILIRHSEDGILGYIKMT